MKRLILLCGLLFTANATATETTEYSRVQDASDTSDIRINNIAGEVVVIGWTKNQVSVEADLGSSVKELVFEVDGDDVLIEVKVPNGRSRNVVSDLKIRVPEASSLYIGTVSADITVEDVYGRQILKAVSGDIETVAYAEDVSFNSVSGDVTIQGDGEVIRVRGESVSGDLDLSSLDGEIEVSSVNGDIEIYESQFESAAMNTVNGDMLYHAGLYGDSEMSIETVNGEVDLLFADKISAKFDIETFNGDIDNCFGPESRRTSKYAPGRELSFSEGGGDGRVTIRTLNGDVSICYD
jgi:DUF4097 and DUF4098 domain-containing protein YvlB